MSQIALAEAYGLKRGRRRMVPSYTGELEFEIRDVHGKTLQTVVDHNAVKIFAKEMLAHRLAPPNVWDPNAGAGTGAWVNSGIDPLQEFALRYIVFGASFDQTDQAPLGVADPRYYQYDQTSGAYIPNRLGIGADYDGGLINPIPISEPLRPLKKIERIYFEPSYQPAGTPLLQEDVRAMNNVVVFETTLRKDEYNGFSQTSSDYFTITEVALVAGKEIDHAVVQECDPHDLFLTGDHDRQSLLALATGGATVTLDPSEAAHVGSIKEGDQVKIVGHGGTWGTDVTASSTEAPSLGQISPYYLVINKALGGSDMTLDRTPVDSKGVPIVGPIGIFRDGFRIFSQRILKSPLKKSADFEIVCRWRILLG